MVEGRDQVSALPRQQEREWMKTIERGILIFLLLSVGWFYFQFRRANRVHSFQDDTNYVQNEILDALVDRLQKLERVSL